MPKSSKLLYNKFCSLPRLRAAWQQLNKSHRTSHGLSSETIESFKVNLETNLRNIQKELKYKRFKFSLLRAAVIQKDRDSKKLRPIRIAEVKDRVVLKAIVKVIQPELEKKLNIVNPASFAYQRKLGPKQAIEKIVSFYKKGCIYALEGDIIKFFDTVDKEYLLNDFIFPNLPDDSLRDLIYEGLNQEIGNWESFGAEEWELFKDSEGGIPQGGSLSPLLSNIYLEPFDSRMLSEGFGLVRYADDFIVMCKTEEEANKAYEIAIEVLESQLKLKLHHLDNINPDSKCRIVRPTQKPIEFLSVCFNGKRTWPSNRKLVELFSKIRYVTDYRRNEDIISLLKRTKNLLEGWLSAFYYTDIDPYFEKIDKRINNRVYNALWKKDWKLEAKGERIERCLTINQRKMSGIPLCQNFVHNLRNNISK